MKNASRIGRSGDPVDIAFARRGRSQPDERMPANGSTDPQCETCHRPIVAGALYSLDLAYPRVIGGKLWHLKVCERCANLVGTALDRFVRGQPWGAA